MKGPQGSLVRHIRDDLKLQMNIYKFSNFSFCPGLIDWGCGIKSLDWGFRRALATLG